MCITGCLTNNLILFLCYILKIPNHSMDEIRVIFVHFFIVFLKNDCLVNNIIIINYCYVFELRNKNDYLARKIVTYSW